MISRMFKLFILFFAFIFSVTPGFSQSVKPVTIIVSGTAYDDPGLTALKDVLKNNPDVKSLKTAFNNNIATLTFTYKNEADELWDNIAAEDKARFKILSVDSKTIKLQQLKGTAATAAKTNSDKNCGCDYFPLCNYDKTRSFMGQTWKGLDNNGKITYYQCTGGVLKAKFELFDNFEGGSLGFATFTALKYNESKGASWKETVDVNGAKYYYEHVIIHKDISITAGGKEYKNAMKVRRMLSAASIFYQGQPQNLMQIENSHTYYVKDVGAFTEKEVKEHLAAPAPGENKQPEKKDNSSYGGYRLLTAFLWKGLNNVYYFQPDGTVQLILGVYGSGDDVIMKAHANRSVKGEWEFFEDSNGNVPVRVKVNGREVLFYLKDNGRDRYLQSEGETYNKIAIPKDLKK
jgi:hypothetical protein